jgi:hypothetical protein
LKLNGTHQLLVYANNVNIVGVSVHNKEENTEVLVVASKKIGLEVNADKSKYMFKSRNQKSGSSHNTKIVRSSLKG